MTTMTRTSSRPAWASIAAVPPPLVTPGRPRLLQAGAAPGDQRILAEKAGPPRHYSVLALVKGDRHLARRSAHEVRMAHLARRRRRRRLPPGARRYPAEARRPADAAGPPGAAADPRRQDRLRVSGSQRLPLPLRRRRI